MRLWRKHLEKMKTFQKKSKCRLINIFSARFIFSIALMISLSRVAFATEQRFYEADSYGEIQYHKPSFTILADGRMIETDSIGNKQHHKQQFLIKGDRVYPINSIGKIQYHKPSIQIKR